MYCPDFSASHVVVVGDAMLDRYMHGDASRLSPEAPVPVVAITKEEMRVGGSANVAVNLTALGAKATLMAAIGDDIPGQQLKQLLLEAKVDCDLIESQFINTTTKLRVIGRQQQLVRLDFEKYYAWPAPMLNAKIKRHIEKAKVVVISDYAKGMIADPQAIISYAKQHGAKVIVDPKHPDLRVYQGADMITPNLKEFEACVGRCQSEDEILTKAKQLLKEGHFGAILVTRGPEGMTLVAKQDDQPLHIPSLAREVFDITGAGDTVIAVLAACLGLDMSYLQAAQLANVAAGISVGRLGTAQISPTDIIHALETNQNDSIHGIMTATQLQQVLGKRKALGHKIIMTNGCFDILHTGHISYLQQARQLGDCLVVAVNDDQSIKRLKGDTRPLNPLADRMTALNALQCVDYVVPFVEDTPRALIANLLPDVLVKGGDYQVSDIAGAQEVIDNGGDVKIIPFVPGYSTTSFIEKMITQKQSAGEVV